MATITINNPTTEVIPPTPIVNSPITVSGNGEVSVSTDLMTNDGNTANTLNWSLSNVQNGAFISTAVDTGSVTYKGATGTVLVEAGQSVRLTFFFNVPQGLAGVVNPDCTADYIISWA